MSIGVVDSLPAGSSSHYEEVSVLRHTHEAA